MLGSWTAQFTRQAVPDGYVLPLKFSLYTPDRLEECLAIYEANVSHGLPPGEGEIYKDALLSSTSLTFCVEDESRMLGTFTAHIGPLPDVYWLSYFMVTPDCHRRGIGTTMFLAALAALPKDHEEIRVFLAAVPAAKTSTGASDSFTREKSATATETCTRLGPCQ